MLIMGLKRMQINCDIPVHVAEDKFEHERYTCYTSLEEERYLDCGNYWQVGPHRSTLMDFPPAFGISCTPRNEPKINSHIPCWKDYG